MNSKVDAIWSKEKRWREEFEKLRAIILGCGLTEEVKWGQACYVLGKSNVVLIHGFKEYCALLFFKGALLKDSHNLLVQQTENVQSARQIRFTNASEIGRLKSALKTIIGEAIEIEKAGLKVSFKPTAEFKMPEEFRDRLAKNANLKRAFEALTPGRQRGYLLHFSSAKQTKTREARIAKATPRILKGKGLDD